MIGEPVELSAETRRIVVVGFGNSLRSDDGIGPRVAAELQTRLDPSRAEVIACRQLLPELAERLRDAKLAVFVDASAEGVPGEIAHRRVDPSDASNDPSSNLALTHGAAPPALLALAERLYGAKPEAHLFTIAGASFGYGEALSPHVAEALPRVISEIEVLLRRTEVHETSAHCADTHEASALA